MPFRLVGDLDGAVLVVPLSAGSSVLGAGDECDLVVEHPTVSRRHAEVRVDDGAVTVRDLDSRNGVWIDDRRVDVARLEPGTRIGFGKLVLALELVSELDGALGVACAANSATQSVPAHPDPGSTVGARPLDGVIAEVVPRLLAELERGQDEATLARAAAAELFERTPAIRAQVRQLGAGGGVLFEARRGDAAQVASDSLVAAGSTVEIILDLPHRRFTEVMSPWMQGVGSVLRVAAGRSAEGLHPVSVAGPPPLPDPPTVEPAMRRLYADAARVAQGDVGIMITGESGTGKEVLARYLHRASAYADGPFVALNCAALPRELLEAELFGVERGVATGVEARAGKLELADGGTLLLDEVADMAPETQAKILRALQEREVFRLGGSSPRRARCRVVAATNRDLHVARARGEFRDDLYYRIAAWVVELPPLRRRRADIPNLAAYFLQSAAQRRGVQVRGISCGALEVLCGYPWPGNIRQLEHEMSRAALFVGDGDMLDSTRLDPAIAAGGPPAPTSTLEEKMLHHERLEILRALQRCDWVATEVAQELGIGRSTLYRRMKAVGIDPDQYRVGPKTD